MKPNPAVPPNAEDRRHRNRGSIGAVNVRLGHDLTRELRGYLGVTGQLEDLTDSAGDRSSSSVGVFGTAGVSLLF